MSSGGRRDSDDERHDCPRSTHRVNTVSGMALSGCDDFLLNILRGRMARAPGTWTGERASASGADTCRADYDDAWLAYQDGDRPRHYAPRTTADSEPRPGLRRSSTSDTYCLELSLLLATVRPFLEHGSRPGKGRAHAPGLAQIGLVASNALGTARILKMMLRASSIEELPCSIDESDGEEHSSMTV